MNLRHQNGHVAELYVAYRLAKRGWEIMWPFTAQSRYDLVAKDKDSYYRVQVKKGTWSKTGPYEYLQARLVGRRSQDRKMYTPEEVDLIAVTDLETLWLVPIEEVKDQTSLCFGSTNPNYKQYKKYDSTKWIVY